MELFTEEEIDTLKALQQKNANHQHDEIFVMLWKKIKFDAKEVEHKLWKLSQPELHPTRNVFK